MKVLGQLFIALVGGIVAIVLYRAFEHPAGGNDAGPVNLFGHWQLAQQLGLDISQGVVIANLVQNGPADKAGIRLRDVILEIEGNTVHSSSRLLEIIASHRPGDELDMRVLRDGQERELTVRLQEAKSMQ